MSAMRRIRRKRKTKPLSEVACKEPILQTASSLKEQIKWSVTKPAA